MDGARKFGETWDEICWVQKIDLSVSRYTVKVKSSSCVSKNGLKNSRQEWLREEKEKLQESRSNGGNIISQNQEEIADDTHTVWHVLPAHHNSSNRRFVEFWVCSGIRRNFQQTIGKSVCLLVTTRRNYDPHVLCLAAKDSRKLPVLMSTYSNVFGPVFFFLVGIVSVLGTFLVVC